MHLNFHWEISICAIALLTAVKHELLKNITPLFSLNNTIDFESQFYRLMIKLIAVSCPFYFCQNDIIFIVTQTPIDSKSQFVLLWHHIICAVAEVIL